MKNQTAQNINNANSHHQHDRCPQQKSDQTTAVVTAISFFQDDSLCQRSCSAFSFDGSQTQPTGVTAVLGPQICQPLLQNRQAARLNRYKLDPHSEIRAGVDHSSQRRNRCACPPRLFCFVPLMVG